MKRETIAAFPEGGTEHIMTAAETDLASASTNFWTYIPPNLRRRSRCGRARCQRTVAGAAPKKRSSSPVPVGRHATRHVARCVPRECGSNVEIKGSAPEGMWGLENHRMPHKNGRRG